MKVWARSSRAGRLRRRTMAGKESVRGMIQTMRTCTAALLLAAGALACSSEAGPSAKGISDLMYGRECKWAVESNKQLRFCRMPSTEEGRERWCCLDGDGNEKFCTGSEYDANLDCRLPDGGS